MRDREIIGLSSDIPARGFKPFFRQKRICEC